MQAPIALPRCFAEILCPDFGFGSLREFRPRCRSFTVIHQVLPQNCASSVRKIYSQITLVQLCGIALTLLLKIYHRIINSVPAAIRMPPITPLTVTVSCRTTNARIIVITTLSLSIGATRLASPICRAL